MEKSENSEHDWEMSSHKSVAWQFSRTALPWPTSGPFMCCTPQIPPDRGFLGGRFRLRQGCLLDPAPQCLLSWADHVKRWAASSMLGHSWTQDALKSSEPQYMKDLHPNPPPDFSIFDYKYLDLLGRRFTLARPGHPEFTIMKPFLWQDHNESVPEEI